MLKLLLTLVLLLISCSTYKSNKSSSVNLSEQVSNYIDLIEDKQDADGFILSNKCDSLLFTGLLAAAAPELNIDLLAARDENGHWHRRPAKDCNPEIGNSRSSISRDMMLGVFWWAWRTKNLQVMEELKESMFGATLPGSGDFVTRTLTPAMYKTFLLLIEKLGGPKSHYVPGGDNMSNQGGFVAHLNVWHILLRGEILGSIPQNHYDLLKYHADGEPKNPLYLLSWAKYSGTSTLAAEVRLKQMFPESELPTTNDWCSEWIIERDYDNSDWAPCPADRPFHTHTGAEFITIVRLVK